MIRVWQITQGYVVVDKSQPGTGCGSLCHYFQITSLPCPFYTIYTTRVRFCTTWICVVPLKMPWVTLSTFRRKKDNDGKSRRWKITQLHHTQLTVYLSIMRLEYCSRGYTLGECEWFQNRAVRNTHSRTHTHKPASSSLLTKDNSVFAWTHHACAKLLRNKTRMRSHRDQNKRRHAPCQTARIWGHGAR